MKIGKWLHRVATGRIAHWNDINNQLVADLWEEIEPFEEPMRAALKGALVSSSQAVDRMLGIEVGRDGWMAVDLKNVQKKTLDRVYFILIDLFLALNAKASPSMYYDVHQAKARLFKTEGVLTHNSILSKPGDNDTETVSKNTEAAVHEAWREIAELLNSEMASHPIPIFEFHAFVLASVIYDAKERQKLGDTKKKLPQDNPSNSDNSEAGSPPENKRSYTSPPRDDYSSGNIAATHSVAKVVARTGAVGGTARWAAKGYHAFIEEHPKWGVSVVIHNLLDARYSTQTDLLGQVDKDAVMDLVLTDPDNRLLKAMYWPGLQHLVVCILTVEAGFSENTLANQEMFDEIIHEELVGQGVPLEFIYNTSNPIYYDDE